MVRTIAPVVYGTAYSHHMARWRWLPAIVFHMVGAVSSGVLFGSILGLLGSVLPFKSVGANSALMLTATLSLLYALHELQLVRLPCPQWPRQVQAWWRHRFHPYITAGLFGLQLGLGYVTYVSVTTLYVVTAAIVLLGSPVYGGLVFAVFALGRTGLLGLLAWSALTDRQALRISVGLIATQPLVQLGNGWALAFAGGWLLAIVMGLPPRP